MPADGVERAQNNYERRKCWTFLRSGRKKCNGYNKTFQKERITLQYLRYRFLFISTTCNKQKQGFKWLYGKRIQTHRGPFCAPKPDACRSVYARCFTAGQNCGKSGLGYRTTSHRGPSLASGRWAFGPPGRRSPLGRGLAFSKTLTKLVVTPTFYVVKSSDKPIEHVISFWLWGKAI